MPTVRNLDITDPHHHLWDLDAHDYPWLTHSFKPRVCGDYGAIRKNYLLEDFFNDIQSLQVNRTVHVEAVIHPEQAVAETAWLQGVADTNEQGIPHGIVAQADFSNREVEKTLEGHCQHSNIRGIRDAVHEGWIDPTNPQPTKLLDPAWRATVGLCKKYRLHFELQIYHQQVEEALELLKLHPDLPVVLTHTGCPADQTTAGFAAWKNAMDRLAKHPNLHVKLSGFGMLDRSWTAGSVKPLILETLEAFGIERCMFASNFPVDSLSCGYFEIWEKFYEATLGFSDDERAKLFSLNANEFYRLN